MNKAKIALFLTAGLVSGVGSRSLMPRPTASDFPEAPTWEDYKGTLDLGSRGDSQAKRGLALAVTSTDFRRCEDLGRQLRRFLRDEVADPEVTLEVWLPSWADSAVVAAFLRSEFLPIGTIRPMPWVDLGNVQAIATPALFILEPDGQLRGVGYTNRMRHVREVSFVDVLSWESGLGDGLGGPGTDSGSR